MRYYHNVPTGCAPKWEQISKTTYNIMLDCYKAAEATPEQIAQRIKKECDPGDPIIYAKCAGGSILAPADMFKF